MDVKSSQSKIEVKPVVEQTKKASSLGSQLGFGNKTHRGALTAVS